MDKSVNTWDITLYGTVSEAISMWYVVHLQVSLDRFLARYSTLPSPILREVVEMVTLRRPHKTIKDRDPGLFVGYVFVRVDPRHIVKVHRALRDASLGEVLSSPGSRYLIPLSGDEVQWIHALIQSVRDDEVASGRHVRITEGPFEGLEGSVEAIVGQTVEVSIPLRRGTARVQCAADALEAA